MSVGDPVVPRATLRTSPPRRRRRLASLLLGLGLGQFLLLSATALAIFFLELPPTPVRVTSYLDPATLARLGAAIDDAATLRPLLGELLADRVQLSIYDDQQRLVATNVEPPLAAPPRRRHRDALPSTGGGPPWQGGPSWSGHADGPDGPPPDDDHRDHHDRHEHEHDGDGPQRPHRVVLPLDLHGAPGIVVAQSEPAGPPGLTGPILTFACGLFVFMLGAILAARWIVRPIEQLSRQARALGAGDLHARSSLDRGDEIGDLGLALDDSANRLEQLMRAERELLANVAHELRTPLARIGVALDLAGEGDADAARASLGEIAVDVSELQTILEDIMTAARFEMADRATAPRMALRQALCGPDTIVTAAAERFRIRHPERVLDVTLADALPPIDVDPNLFRRVLDNLLENAHKYTPDADAPIRLTVTATAAGVEFVVADRGVGIAPEDLPRIFTAFFRGERSRSRATGGVGLGLTLVKRILDGHRGTIAVDSAVGRGTTMKVTVPAAREVGA